MCISMILMPYRSAKIITPIVHSFQLSAEIPHIIISCPAAYLVSPVQEVVARAKEELKRQGETTKSGADQGFLERGFICILNKSENATLQLSIFYEKVLNKKYLLKLNNVAQTSSKRFVETPQICLV